MKKKKLCTWLLCTVMVLAAGCGSGKDAAADVDTAQENAAAAQEDANAAQEDGDAAQEDGDAAQADAGQDDAALSADGSVELPAPGEIVMSGRCGENVTYTFDSKGIMTVSGTGKMVSEEGGEYPKKDDIVYFVVEEGVTGAWNFWMSDNLRYVSLPSTIEHFKFESCEKLTAVHLAEGMKMIDDGALSGCDGLTSVVLPESLTTVNASIFTSCNNLSDIKLPAGVTHLGSGVFAYTGITEMTIPQGVTELRKELFCGCDKLTSVTLPSGVTSIGRAAFMECPALTDVYYEGTEEEFQNIQIDGDNDALLNANIHYNAQGA